MRNLLVAIAVLSAVGFTACAPADVDLKAEGETLMQTSRDLPDLVATGDIDSIMAGWADDAVMMPPGLPALEGKAAIRRYVEAASQTPGFQISWEPMSMEVASSRDMAYMIERNIIIVEDPEGERITTHGKVVTVWRKDSTGTWKNVVDMWNETPPPET